MASGYLLSACQVEPVTDDPSTAGPTVARFFLEIVNDASERVRVQIVMTRPYFEIPPNRIDRRSGVIDVDSRDKTTFRMVQHLYVRDPSDDVWDSVHIRWFGEAHFYEPDADSPYKSYIYESIKCLGFYCEGSGKDTLVIYESSDGTTEQLFLESPDRPFYLQRDAQDPRIGRVVITFVPDSDATSGSSGDSDG